MNEESSHPHCGEQSWKHICSTQNKLFSAIGRVPCSIPAVKHKSIVDKGAVLHVPFVAMAISTATIGGSTVNPPAGNTLTVSGKGGTTSAGEQASLMHPLSSNLSLHTTHASGQRPALTRMQVTEATD